MPPNAQPSAIGDANRPSESEIRLQLARILSSEAFDASERNRNFLSYVIEETLSGRAAGIKGYTVAQSVFGRGPDFDPQLDPVVRIEASRLRRSLERYYLTTGRLDSVQIGLPKGGYVPQFERASVTSPNYAGVLSNLAARPSLQPARRSGPAIIVLPFENLGDGPQSDLLARGMTEELVGRLLAYKELNIICANTSFKIPATADPAEIGRTFGLGYVLKSAIRVAGMRLRISTQLLDIEHGEYLWADSFDREMTSDHVWAIQDQIAAEIATRLGAPYGAIAKVAYADLAGREQQHLNDYLAVLKAYGYRRRTTAENHYEIRDCLEQAVAAHPACFEAWAQLSEVYVDEYRYGFNRKPGSLDRALAAAEQAVRWGRESALSHLAISLVHHCNRDYPNAYAAARHAISLNPENPEVLARASLRFVLSGAWDEGMSLLRRAMERDPDPPPWNYNVLTLDSLRRKDYRTALGYAECANEGRLPLVQVFLCVIYGALGARAEAEAALAAACADGRQWGDLWNHVCRTIHDEVLLDRIKSGVEQVLSPPRARSVS